jgi:hypothetical protein
MATLTRQEVVSVLGPSDGSLIVELLATGATPEELAQAWAWVTNDEAMMNDGHALPTGRAAELVALLSPEDEDHEI